MITAICDHCNKGVASDEYVYVINRRAYCPECFDSFVRTEAKMKACEYVNSWGSLTKVAE